MIKCRSYFNTSLIRLFTADSTLNLLEIIDRYLDDDGISVRLPIERICNNKKVLIRHYERSLRFLQNNQIIFNWKSILKNKYPHITIPDDIYLVNPNYIRHINKTQFKKYLKRTANKIKDTNWRCVVDEYWVTNIIPIYYGDEYGGFYIGDYDISTEYNPNSINKPVFSI